MHDANEFEDGRVLVERTASGVMVIGKGCTLLKVKWSRWLTVPFVAFELPL